MGSILVPRYHNPLFRATRKPPSLRTPEYRRMLKKVRMTIIEVLPWAQVGASLGTFLIIVVHVFTGRRI